MIYVGTSTVRAELLVVAAAAEPLAVRGTTYAEAVAQACRHALTDGGEPLVMSADCDGDVVLASQLVPHELVEDVAFDTAVAETAGVGGAINKILSLVSDAHKAVKDVVGVGSGANAELPSVVDLLKNGRRKKKTFSHVVRSIRKLHRTAVKKLRSMMKAKKPRRAASKPAAPKKPAQPKKPTTKQSGGGWGAQPAGSPSKKVQQKSASADITVSGKQNGQPATFTVKKGRKYRLEKTSTGTRLIVPGMRGQFFVSPKDIGKLK